MRSDGSGGPDFKVFCLEIINEAKEVGTVKKLRKGAGKEKITEMNFHTWWKDQTCFKEDNDSTFRKAQRTNKARKGSVQRNRQGSIRGRETKRFSERRGWSNAVKVKENKNQQNIVFDSWGVGVGRETGTDIDKFPLSNAYSG